MKKVLEMPSLHETLDFTYEMHKGVNDWTGVPYITHPIAVMLYLHHTCSEDDQHLALLHDVLEDCQERIKDKFALRTKLGNENITLEILFDAIASLGYSDYVMQGLRLLTRDFWEHLTYLEYIQNIANSGHRGAIWVKFSDNKHNSDADRILKLPEELREKSHQMTKRYHRSITILWEKIKDEP